MSLMTLKGNRVWPSWFKRVGAFGFAFFFVKGLLWLAFAYVAQRFI